MEKFESRQFASVLMLSCCLKTYAKGLNGKKLHCSIVDSVNWKF